ncbi:MAG: signal peptidase II [Bacteroidetes bacterium]|nr:signal peptidase II [Bacteroidota bacterium]
MSDTQIPEASTRSFSKHLYWVTAAIVVVDQLTKLLIKGASVFGFPGMPLHSSKPFIDDILRITYVENPGIAFGINFPALKVFFSIFSGIAAIAIFVYLERNGSKLHKWDRLGLVMIMGGAIGNLIDRCFYGVIFGEERLFYGHVVDFLDFGYKTNWWPVFNIADSAVTVGVSILVLSMLLRKPVTVEPAGASESQKQVN